MLVCPARKYVTLAQPSVKNLSPAPPTSITLTSGVSVRPRLPTREPIISDLGLDSVRLTWKPAELPYYSRQATPITYTVDYQVSYCYSID